MARKTQQYAKHFMQRAAFLSPVILHVTAGHIASLSLKMKEVVFCTEPSMIGLPCSPGRDSGDHGEQETVSDLVSEALRCRNTPFGAKLYSQLTAF